MIESNTNRSPNPSPKEPVKTAKQVEKPVVISTNAPNVEDETQELTIQSDEARAACGLDPLLLGC
jgi:hypothetical protein